MFCHDHQNRNGHCDRGNDCRFIHCTRQEEEEYRRSGYLPPHIRDQVKRSHWKTYLRAIPRYENPLYEIFIQKFIDYRQSTKEYRVIFLLCLEPGQFAKIT